MSKRTQPQRKPGPMKLDYEDFKKALGPKMRTFAEGCRKAYSTGQPGDEPADTTNQN